jgi:hypothetical protein
MRYINLILFGLLLAGLFSCAKEEGEGGTSTISGKVFVRDYNANFTILESEYYAPEVDVYIVYGNDFVYSDRFRTHHDGTYRFQFLRKGNYTIYAYSKDTTGNYASGLIPVEKLVKITSNNQEIEVEDILIIK